MKIKLYSILAICLAIMFSINILSMRNIYAYNDAIEGDFRVVWYSENILHYDEFYIVSPNTVNEHMLLTYGRNINCRSLSIIASNLGTYTFRIIVNGSEQYVYIDGGMIRIQLININTRNSIVDQFFVPGLYAVYLSIVPSIVWAQNPITGGMIRVQQLTFYVEGYGIENIKKGYNISTTFPTLYTFVVDNIAYSATIAINHYISIYIEYPSKPHNVFIVFAPSVDEQQTTITVTSTITKTTTYTTTISSATTITSIVSVPEKTITRETTQTTTVSEYRTIITTIPTTITTEKTLETTIEKSTTITQTTGYSIYTLIGVVIVSILISVILTLFIFSRRLF